MSSRCGESVYVWESDQQYSYTSQLRCMLTSGHTGHRHLMKDSNGQLFWWEAET